MKNLGDMARIIELNKQYIARNKLRIHALSKKLSDKSINAISREYIKKRIKRIERKNDELKFQNQYYYSILSNAALRASNVKID